MSRIGKKPILIPETVKATIEGQKIIIEGPKGKLEKNIIPELEIEIKEGKIFLSPKVKSKNINALWGTYRALIANMIKGVTEGYQKVLEIEGLGYRAEMEGESLVLKVGYSHPIKINPPPGIKISIEKNIINVLGIDKELVGQTAATIRKVKPVEPYKGKGIKYVGEKVKRKVGKKVAGVST